MAEKLTVAQQEALDNRRDAKIRAREDKARTTKSTMGDGKLFGNRTPPASTPYDGKGTPPPRPLSNAEAAAFMREMQGGKPTKEDEYNEFTRQPKGTPMPKFAKGGSVKSSASIRGGGIESRGKTKGRMI